MTFVDKSFITSSSSSLLSLYKIGVYSKFKDNDVSIRNKLRFWKTCCKRCLRICPCNLVRYRVQLKTPAEGCDNFVLISAKYIVDFYRWTQEYALKRLLADDFLRSTVVSTFLFAIGLKLSLELNT